MTDPLDIRKQSIISQAMNMELVPVFPEEELNLNEYKKIPVAELSLLEASVSSILPPFRTIAQTISFNDGRHFYEALDKAGNPTKLMYKFKDSDYLISSRHEAGKLAQTRFREVSGQTMQSVQTIPIDPAAMMMAMVLIDVERKLDKIQETQQDILNFMKIDKLSKMEGNAVFLSDILSNYKYNWNDSIYKTNMHIKVLDIRQEAEQNISFYRKQIEAHMSKNDFDPKGKMSAVQTEFKNYRLSLYLYGFSSFLEIMLQENFNQEYLMSITHKIQDYGFKYRELYSSCYTRLEESKENSAKAMLPKGAAKAAKKLGDTATKSQTLEKRGIGNKLFAAQDKLEQTQAQDTASMMEKFADSKDSDVVYFVSLIGTVNEAYNQPKEMITDGEYVYFKPLNA